MLFLSPSSPQESRRLLLNVFSLYPVASRRCFLCLRLCVPDQWSSVSLSILCSVGGHTLHFQSLWFSDQRSASTTLSVLLHIRLLVLYVVIFLPCISFSTFPLVYFPLTRSPSPSLAPVRLVTTKIWFCFHWLPSLKSAHVRRSDLACCGRTLDLVSLPRHAAYDGQSTSGSAQACGDYMPAMWLPC